MKSCPVSPTERPIRTQKSFFRSSLCGSRHCPLLLSLFFFKKSHLQLRLVFRLGRKRGDAPCEGGREDGGESTVAGPRATQGSEAGELNLVTILPPLSPPLIWLRCFLHITVAPPPPLSLCCRELCHQPRPPPPTHPLYEADGMNCVAKGGE